jgi:pSer/pThr/pTyr-binding forkhead associated (FHA) protein
MIFKRFVGKRTQQREKDMVKCLSCGHEHRESSCPKCGRPAVDPYATMPMMDQEDVPTILSVQAGAGRLTEGKKYALVVVSGNEPGKVFPINKTRVTIGRIACDINLNDSELSRQHALIAISGTAVRLEDLGSTNGTFVDEQRITHADLEDRSEFRVGNHLLLFSMTDADLDM